MAVIYSYTRVSTTEQASDDRSSLADQERRIQGAAMMRGEDISRVFCDPGVSGGTPLKDRPAGRDMLAILQSGDVVIAAKLDRIFRSASDALTNAEAFQRQGVSLILADLGPDPVTGNGTSKLFFTMLAAFAEFEKTRILERMHDGRTGKKARGGHIGGKAPYGWRIVGTGRDAKLEACAEEQATIAAAREWRESGASFRDISTSLALRGMLARNGAAFSAEQIRRML